MPHIAIERVTPERAAAFEAVLRAQGGEAAVAGFRASRAGYDLLASDAAWVLLARCAGQPAGAAVVARLPKTDARRGFLFVDELWVLPAYRRQGVATSLLAHVEALARALGLAGVRLLVRPENAAARAAYRRLGFAEHPSLFCEKRFPA
jgi:ribosomal protein S18 acetylase RimI-like enzyme